MGRGYKPMVEILGPSRLLMEETKAVVHGRKPCVMGRGYKPMAARVFFIFIFFKKKITEIYFLFQILQSYTPTAR